MAKLFIIGNGFDSAHKLKTSYNHFREYLLSNNPEINMEELIIPEEIHDKDGGKLTTKLKCYPCYFI